VLGQAAGRREDRRRHSDQGCYQERYRLTGIAAYSLAIGVIPLVPAVPASHPFPWLILSLAFFALMTVPCLVVVASRKIAFRADQAGITLSADPLNWPFHNASAVFVPRADAEAIVLYHRPAPADQRPASVSGPTRGQAGWRTCYRSFNGI
jgi:hypothetical protein